MQYALSFSGGKDSMLALHRACEQGLDVRYLFNIYEGVSGRVRFHGVSAEAIAVQAASLGIELVQDSTHPDDYEAVFLRLLDRFRLEGLGGIIFGNIHLADIRAWYEERVTATGFQHVEPIWGEPGEKLVREVVELGYEPRIVSVDLARAPEAWLGRIFNGELLEELRAHPEIDPCGERGEYHTFVEKGPLLRKLLRVELGRRVDMDGHGLLDVRARLEL